MYALEPQQKIPSHDVPRRSVWVGVAIQMLKCLGEAKEVSISPQGHTLILSKLKLKSEVGN